MADHYPNLMGDVYLIEQTDADGEPTFIETSATSSSLNQVAADIWAGNIHLPSSVVRINRTKHECAEADAEVAAVVGRLSLAARRSPTPDLCEWLDERRAEYFHDGEYLARKRDEEESRRVDEIIEARRERGLSFGSIARRCFGVRV